MKTIELPCIEGLERMSYGELDLAMETVAAGSFIGCVNWKEFPYRPLAAFSVARSRTHLAVLYHVRGLDLRVATLEDNGPVWEDSCCEMFVADPADGTYYNFEMNCMGVLLAAKRTGRNDARPFSAEALSRIIRHSTLAQDKGPYKVEEAGTIHHWSIGMCVPFDLIGIDPDNPPASIRANFYKCADKSAHPHFLSWNPIDVPTPDFHRPEFFGELVF